MSLFCYDLLQRSSPSANVASPVRNSHLMSLFELAGAADSLKIISYQPATDNMLLFTYLQFDR